MRSSIAVMLVAVGVVCTWGGTNAVAQPEPPFHRGVNLTGWLPYVNNARQIQFARFTKQDFVDIKSLGCDVIRLPIYLDDMTSGAPNYIIDPLFFYFLDQIVDWCEELKIHLVLDNCSSDVDAAGHTDVNIDKVLVPIWSQMAAHYRNRSMYLYYEILSEPQGITDARWGQIQQAVIDAIRAVDTVHTIVVTGAGWGSYNNLQFLPPYADGNLIYTFHFYDPFMFTHQGASWTIPSMVPLTGVSFPYGAGPMPACPPALKGTWVESSLKSYANDGTVQRVQQLIDIAVRFRAERQVPLFCGEFGVYMENSDPDQRVYWYEQVSRYLDEKKIARTSWDYRDGFGLFKKGSNERFGDDLNLPLVRALGLIPPPQTPFVPTPELTGFDLYRNSIAENVRNASSVWNGTLDFFHTVAPGDYCIYCTGFGQYGRIVFQFWPTKDLTRLLRSAYALDFWVAGDTPGARFDVRFVDTKTSDPQDHPWRMNVTVDQSFAAWDGQWHHVQIPLRSFVPGGSVDNNVWFPPPGQFDWSAVDCFQIVAEHHSFAGMHFWFDDIRVAKPPGAR